jgi:hypothetical protein
MPEQLIDMRKSPNMIVLYNGGGGEKNKTKTLNYVAWVREWTIPTQRPPFTGKVGANFCRLGGAAWSA